MGEYFIHTDQMVVGYDGKPLIKDVEIKMKRGEILTLIGPNGAGKSTILKSMTRQLKLVAGTVYMNQEMMSKMSGKEVAKKLAVVMTERIQPELMTCEDIVATLSLYGNSRNLISRRLEKGSQGDGDGPCNGF